MVLARFALTLAALLALGSCQVMQPPVQERPIPSAAPAAAAGTLPAPPSAPREFRGAWIASVANIDWPSRADLSVAQQQAEIVAILQRAQQLQLNALLLQVRPSADALYPSALEPWSEYLTGAQGRAPDPWYDPLALWIELAHERGIELHAWINPYRARHSSARSPVAATHISNTQPQAVKVYGDSLWMDPAEPAARQQTLDVVSDLVRRYDLDGVHIDDYFYPYPIAAGAATDPSGRGELDFPDEPAWLRYQGGGGTLARPDWRRQQVNELIESLYRRVHEIKPWVRSGISPFGLGRPDRRGAGISGFSQYDRLYADAETWLAQGWLDYLAPQLYWPIEQPAQAFATLLQTWADENVQHRHLWPGLFTSRIDASVKSWAPQQILNQIALTRQNPGASGHVHFSMAALLQDRQGVSALLQAQSYAQPALVPGSPWLESDAPAAPSLELQPTGTALTILPGAGKPARLYAVWKRHGGVWRFSVQPASRNLVELAEDPQWGPLQAVVVSAVDRVGNEGPRAWLRLMPATP